MKKNSNKIKIILVIIFALLIEIILSLILKNKISAYSESLYYSSQIVSSFCVMCSVIIAAWQYYLSVKGSNRELSIVQVQRAIDLAEYYKDNILIYYPAISYVFQEGGISEILAKIKISDIRDFDTDELNRLLSPQDIQKLKKSQFEVSFCKAFINANEIYNLNINLLDMTTDENGKVVVPSKCDIEIAVTFMANFINNVLNNMEYFALHFTHNVADESVVYQSLHDSYIKMVILLYYYIANTNNDPCNKLFTNVISLYNTWYTKQCESNQTRTKIKKSLESHGTVIEK